MPRGIYSNIKCPSWHKKFNPQEHQILVQKYFALSPFKGLLLYHRLGSGKTCTSIITSDTLLKMGKIKHVYVFSPGSLRQGWIKEFCNVCGSFKNELSEKYTFITYNYNVAKELPATFDNSLVIIDEVHNLVNSVKNQSTVATQIYNKLMKSDCRILALSGTPIFNNVYEWPILGNLLKPGAFPDIIIPEKGVNKEAFMTLFNVENDGTIVPKNKEAFQNALSGIISFVAGMGSDTYPELIIEPIIKIKMSEEQELKYWKAFNTELTIINYGPPKMQLMFTNPAKYAFDKGMWMMAKKRIISRKASNFYYPEQVYKDFPERPKDDVSPKGWVSLKYFSNNELKNIYSPKFAALLNKILDNFNAKHMVFTFFKEQSGVYLLEALIKMCGFNGIETAVFSGDLTDAKRVALLKKYNNPLNRWGDQIKVIFVTDAGAEGITLLETQHIHILESDTRENKISQAVGRAVRYKSHYLMPKHLQKVHLWRYWSVSRHQQGDVLTIKTENINDNGEVAVINKNITVRPTIDEILYDEGKKKMNGINSFLNMLSDASI
jgi:superfamily II DNA or RNA helicase